MEALIEQRREVIQGYTDSLGPDDIVAANKIANDITNGDGPLAETVVIIPVAAHQEAAQIPNTLSQFAKQHANRPFSLVLGMNSPSSKASKQSVADSFEAVEAGQKAYPELDIRTTFNTYKKPVIGRIRRDLWNGVAVASRTSGDSHFNGDTIAVNYDIDTVKIFSKFIDNIQSYYSLPTISGDEYTVQSPAGTETFHAPSKAHPNISRAVGWHDFLVRAMGLHFEAGTVIPLTAYADRGGINADNTEREILNLTHQKKLRRIPGTISATSMRRYIADMDSYGYDIWPQGTFSAEDECRSVDTDQFPDITKAKMYDLVEETVRSSPLSIIFDVVKDVSFYMNILKTSEPEIFDLLTEDEKFFLKQIEQKTERIRTVGERALDRVIGRPAYAKRFGKRMSSEEVRDAAMPYFRLLTSPRENKLEKLLIKR